MFCWTHSKTTTCRWFCKCCSCSPLTEPSFSAPCRWLRSGPVSFFPAHQWHGRHAAGDGPEEVDQARRPPAHPQVCTGSAGQAAGGLPAVHLVLRLTRCWGALETADWCAAGEKGPGVSPRPSGGPRRFFSAWRFLSAALRAQKRARWRDSGRGNRKPPHQWSVSPSEGTGGSGQSRPAPALRSGKTRQRGQAACGRAGGGGQGCSQWPAQMYLQGEDEDDTCCLWHTFEAYRQEARKSTFCYCLCIRFCSLHFSCDKSLHAVNTFCLLLTCCLKISSKAWKQVTSTLFPYVMVALSIIFIPLWQALLGFFYSFGPTWCTLSCLYGKCAVGAIFSGLSSVPEHLFRETSVNRDIYRSWGVNIQHLIWLFPLSHLKRPNVHPVCLCYILFSTKWISLGDIVGMLLTTQMWVPIEFSYRALGNNIVLLTATVRGLFKQTSEVCTPAFTQK